MSYDLRLGVKVDGTDIIAVIDQPEWDTPTYNLGKMFRAATGWDFDQSTWYRVTDVYPKIQKGIAELIAYPEKYKQYETEYSKIGTAIKTLESLKDCIDGHSDPESAWYQAIPMEHLWVAW